MSIRNLAWIRQLWQSFKKLTTNTRSNLSNPLNSFGHEPEFIIIGLGRFGTSLAMTLDAYDHEVLAIDSSESRVQQLSNVLPHVIQLDATNIDALIEVGAEAFDNGVVCIGSNFEANVLATVNLRKLGVRRVMSKVRTVTQQEILEKVGADQVILPEHEAGVRLGRKLAAVDFIDFMELTHDTGVVEIIAPPQLVGKSLLQSEIRNRYSLTVIAIRRKDDIIVSPGADEIIREDDILVVLGRTEDCQRLRETSLP